MLRRAKGLVCVIAIMSCGLSLWGCASTQLNFNALDLASTVDSLVTEQVLSNLAKFIDYPYAIPSQVSISSGTVTTNNSITPSVTSPLNVAATTTNTIATTVAEATSTTSTNTRAGTRSNMGLTVNATDQWTQTWGLSPLTDIDQLRRLRVLYQFGAGHLDEQDLLCNYPIIQSKGSSPSPAIGTVTYPTSDGKSVTVKIGAPPDPPTPKRYLLRCKTGLLVLKPDPAFLNPPSCIICASRSEGDIYLYINRRLRNGWLRSTNGPFGISGSGISLGYHRHKNLYVESEEDLRKFYEFSLFVLEAATQSATSATGQSAKGGTTKNPAFLLAPSIQLLQ